jgi:hypothetical protein
MFEFSADVRKGAKKRIADVNIKLFESQEFTVSCKEVTIKRPVLTHGASYVVYDGEYRGSTVAVKVVPVREDAPTELINTLVDLTAHAALPHENVAAFYGAGCAVNASTQQREVCRTFWCCRAHSVLSL